MDYRMMEYLGLQRNNKTLFNKEYQIWDTINRLNDSKDELTLNELKETNDILYQEVLAFVGYYNQNTFCYEEKFKRILREKIQNNTFEDYLNLYIDKVQRPYSNFDIDYQNTLHVQGNVFNEILREMDRDEIEIQRSRIPAGVSFGYNGQGNPQRKK